MPSYTKVSGVWRPIIGQFTKVSGAWRTVRATWTKVAGVWKVTWFALILKQGYIDAGTTTKLSTYVELYEESVSPDDDPGNYHSGEATVVSTTAIDLTSVTNVQIDWQQVDGNGEIFLIASTTQMGSQNTYNARISEINGVFLGRHTTSLNVSALSGTFCIRGHVYSQVDFTGWGTLRVYRILLDGVEVWNASNAGSWV